MSNSSRDAGTPGPGAERTVSADAQALIRALESVTKPSRDLSAFVAAVASIAAAVFTGLTYLFGPDSLTRDQTNKEIANCTKAVAVVGALSLPVNDSAAWEQRKGDFWNFYTGERFLLSKVDIEPILVNTDSLVRIEHITPGVFVASQDPRLSKKEREARAYAVLNAHAEAHAREIARRCNSLYKS